MHLGSSNTTTILSVESPPLFEIKVFSNSTQQGENLNDIAKYFLYKKLIVFFF